MKMLKCIAVSMVVLSSSMGYAQTPAAKTAAPANAFTERKAQIIKNFSDEKTALEQVITCLNAAQEQSEMKKCYDIRKAAMQKIKERKSVERKERLQNEIKKIEAETKDAPKEVKDTKKP